MAKDREQSPFAEGGFPDYVMRISQDRAVRKSAESGFSLVELIVVMAIVAIVSMIAIPSVRAALETHRLQGSAYMVASKLMEARGNALKRNRDCSLQIIAAERRVQVQTAGPIDVGGPGFLSTGVNFVAPPASIPFDSMGRPTNPPPQILTLQSTSGRQVTVTVTPTGRVRVD